jgi:hypothetical protein
MTSRTLADADRESRQRVAESNSFKAFHVHRWVLWWFYVGVVCGIVAITTLLLRDLTQAQEHVLIFLGIMHWLLGGLVCWACEGIRTENPPLPPVQKQAERTNHEKEWHAASEFLFPGGGHTLLPPSRAQQSREALEMYLREKDEHSPHPL